MRHAPRERVSWNCCDMSSRYLWLCHAPRERVSWNDWRSSFVSKIGSHAPRERVSWNFPEDDLGYTNFGHAPRERVSWNLLQKFCLLTNCVTLHVSVWVEIMFSPSLGISVQKSRSTWACELKSLAVTCGISFSGHAPRERVSWNALRPWELRLDDCHAPRERVSWNAKTIEIDRRTWVTLHVSVWVEILKTHHLTPLYVQSRSTWACELKFSIVYSSVSYIESRSTWACELKCTWE